MLWSRTEGDWAVLLYGSKAHIHKVGKPSKLVLDSSRNLWE